MYAPLPARYAYLNGRDDLPNILDQMLKLHGLKEAPGAADNPVILDMAREVGVAKDYRHDETPWCGLALAAAVHRAGYKLPASPLWALDWSSWGTSQARAMLGDVIVYRRAGGGHVGLYVGEDDGAYHILGGNQGDAVSIVRLTRSSWTRGASLGVVAIRRSPWRIGPPASVAPIKVSASGAVGSKVV